MIDLKSLQTSFMEQDPTTIVIAQALDLIINDTENQIRKALIYPAIDTLDNDVLDELAWQFKALGYKATLSLSQKRALIKNAIKINKYIGTAYAVKSTLSSLYETARIVEWFEDGSAPYTFKIKVDYIGDTPYEKMEDTYNNVVDAVFATKNVRSKLEAVSFVMGTDGFVRFGSYSKFGVSLRVFPYKPTNIDTETTIRAGAWYKYANKSAVMPKGE